MNNSDWIPIAEKLPLPCCIVMLSFGENYVPQPGYYLKENDGSGAFYILGYDKPASCYNLFVNAWMPMPEPYEEETPEVQPEWKSRMMDKFLGSRRGG